MHNGIPLVVELAAIGVADDVESTALAIYRDPSSTYRHFVNDRIGDFHGEESQVDEFLNDLQYTIEYPSEDGSLPYINMDILIHSDRSTSVYRNRLTPTFKFMSTTNPVPLHPPKTMP